jgi:hypothetical protein
MHLRPPSFDPGVTAFVWAVLLGAFIWAGLLAIGVSGATAVVFGAVSAAAIFLFVRIFGEEEPRQTGSARDRMP